VIGVSAFAYAQARAQARHGERLTEPAWQVLSATVAFRGFLEQARASSLRPWLHNISPISSEHDIERLLRENLRARIADVVSWVPGKWRHAVQWTTPLVDLPALDHLLQGEATEAWMRDDPLLGAVAAADPTHRVAVLADGPLAPLVRGESAQDLVDRWMVEWRRRLPKLQRDARVHLDRLVQRVQALRATDLLHPAVNSMAHAHDVTSGIIFEFRRSFLQPAAIFSHLLLDAVEFVRLRGALLSRALFERESR